jgi:dienelactone hydrolase
MSRRTVCAALASCALFLTHTAAWPGDDSGRATLTGTEVEALVSKLPHSIDAWESRRPALVGWLEKRLDEPRPTRSDWSADAEFSVPGGHVGRGPAVIYFAEANDESAGGRAQELTRAGYVVLLVREQAVERPAAAASGEPKAKAPRSVASEDLKAVEFLLGRREVDPDRVAALGIGSAARRAWWAAAVDQRLAAVVSFGTPQTATLEDQVMVSLIAARPHRLVLDTKNVRDREAAYQRWVAGPQSIYERYELPSLFSTKLGVGFDAKPESPAWQDTLSWLKDEL